MSMFVLSKWQRVALPTRWRASVPAFLYFYLTFLDHRTNISRKVHAPRHVSASGAPNKFKNSNMDKTSQHQNFHSHISVNQFSNQQKFSKRSLNSTKNTSRWHVANNFGKSHAAVPLKYLLGNLFDRNGQFRNTSISFENSSSDVLTDMQKIFPGR